MRLYITATGRFVGTQDEARKDGRGWYLEEVPTDKQSLIDYLNERAANTEPGDAIQVPVPPVGEDPMDPPCAYCGEPTVQGDCGDPECEANKSTDLGTADDGLPEARTAFTAAQIHHMFKPHPAHLRELCYQISKLKAEDLGAVAFEVAHGFARRGAA